MVIDNFTLYIYQSMLYNMILRCHFTKHICYVTFYQESKKRCFQIGFRSPNLKILKHVDSNHFLGIAGKLHDRYLTSNIITLSLDKDLKFQILFFKSNWMSVCLFVGWYVWLLNPLKRPKRLSLDFKERFKLARKWFILYWIKIWIYSSI